MHDGQVRGIAYFSADYLRVLISAEVFVEENGISRADVCSTDISSRLYSDSHCDSLVYKLNTEEYFGKRLYYLIGFLSIQ